MPRLVLGNRKAAVVAATALVALGACLLEPPPRDNYHDSNGNSWLKITPDKDTAFSHGEIVKLTVTTFGGFPTPAGATGPSFLAITGGTLFTQMNETDFRVLPSVTVQPARYGVKAWANPFVDFPVDTAYVWVRQRPVSLDISCTPWPRCLTIVAMGPDFTLNVAGLDANGWSINWGTGAYRWGTLVSRQPSVVEIISRGNSSFVIHGLTPGSSWIVLSGDGIADSVEIVVVP